MTHDMRESSLVTLAIFLFSTQAGCSKNATIENHGTRPVQVVLAWPIDRLIHGYGYQGEGPGATTAEIKPGERVRLSEHALDRKDVRSGKASTELLLQFADAEPSWQKWIIENSAMRGNTDIWIDEVLGTPSVRAWAGKSRVACGLVNAGSGVHAWMSRTNEREAPQAHKHMEQ